MGSHYLTLRMHPEKDFEGKSEADIIKKIDANYQALLARVPQMYATAEAREQALKELETAKAVLSDLTLRGEYVQQVKEKEQEIEKQRVTIEFVELSDQVLDEIDEEIQKRDS